MTISIPITCKTTQGNKIVNTRILLNSGAGGTFMHRSFAKKHHILLHKLPKPILPQNVDGTLNQAGQIDYFTWIQTKIDGRKDLVRLLITDIGSQDIIFGLPWHKEVNPEIKYSKGKITLPEITLKTLQRYYVKNELRKKQTNTQTTTIHQILLRQEND